MTAVHIFDIDATIANYEHRAPLLERACVVCLAMKQAHHHALCDACGTDTDSRISQESWDAFFAEHLVYSDAVIEKSLEYANILRQRNQPMFFLTSRGEGLRDVTTRWLQDKFNWHPRERLYMRSVDQEGIPASKYKEAQFKQLCADHGYGPDTLFYFYEDDTHVIHMYRKHGIVVQCPQAWEHIMPDVGSPAPERSWEIPHLKVK